MEYLSQSAEETKKIASDFANTLEGGEFISLVGELGAGKTTFVQGVAEAFGVQGPVRSPTFTVMNIHKMQHEKIKELIHLDFYRLQDATALFELGLEEWLYRDDVVIFAEWVPESFSFSSEKMKTIELLKAENEISRRIDIRDS